MAGLFITFEGIDGSGKSSQAKLLYDWLLKNGYKVILKREPGGTDIGEKIRNIIIDNDNKEMAMYTEAYLYAAARAQLVQEVIKPMLAKDYIVICDRFLDSSIAYQGAARGLGADAIETINSYGVDGLKPDITLLLDIEPKEALKRKATTAVYDRIENEKMDFHNAVYMGYKKIAENNSRIKVVDGLPSQEEISGAILEIIKPYLD